MAKYPMTDIIAYRRFGLLRPDGARDVLLSIGKPAPFPDSPQGDWYCPWTIEGPDRSHEHHAGGVDGVQALLMAISAIRAELQVMATRGKLTWLDHEDLGLDLVSGAA
jgi:hypothetical protein